MRVHFGSDESSQWQGNTSEIGQLQRALGSCGKIVGKHFQYMVLIRIIIHCSYKAQTTIAYQPATIFTMFLASKILPREVEHWYIYLVDIMTKSVLHFVIRELVLELENLKRQEHEMKKLILPLKQSIKDMKRFTNFKCPYLYWFL